MVNSKIESMEVQKTGLLAQIRHLDGEAHDLLLQIRTVADNLSKMQEFEKRRPHLRSGKGMSFPKNQDRDLIGQIEAELNDLKDRRAIVLNGLLKIRQEMNNLAVLLDECRRHTGQIQPTRMMPLVKY